MTQEATERTAGEAPPGWLRLLALATAAGVLSFGAVGLLLAVNGWYRPALAFPLGAVGWIVLLVLARPVIVTEASASRGAHVYAAIGVVAILAITVWNAAHASQHVLVNRDGGSYANTARWIARDGSLSVKPRVGPFANPPTVGFDSFAVYQMPDGTLQFQFAHLLPVVLAEYPPECMAKLCGVTTAEVVQLARDYGTIKPAAIRLNYGMQRHAGGGIAARTIACLPALVGAWRDAAGGIVLSTADFYKFDHAALERPDLLAGRRPRTINQSKLGDALTSAKPPVRAIVIYNNNPVAVCPESDKVIAGFSREDLFTVVIDHFQTDSADYADIVLPATTQLEHYDVHKSYGHLYMLANNPAIAPVGEALPNSEIFRRLAARMGFDEPCFRDSDEDICRAALAGKADWEALKRDGWQRLAVPERFAPFAHGGFPTPSGRCEFYSEWLEKQGVDPLPFYNPPVEVADAALAERYPLAFISPPARHFLNSSFANLPRFREFEREPHLDMHPQDAATRGIRDGDHVRVYNARGSYTLRARVNGKPRPGVVVAPSVWWKKYSPDGRNANNVTSQRTTDLGGGATFYDCRVEVERVERAAA